MSLRSSGSAVLLSVTGLTLGAGIALTVAQSDRPARMAFQAFQRSTGGIGLGAAVSPAWSFFAVDARISGTCENELFPLPGSPCYSPYHGAAVADLPPLEASARR